MTPHSRPGRTTVQLVPPARGGVRDYAECLQRAWQATGMASHLLALGEDQARGLSLARRLEKIAGANGPPCTLLLHYSGYGFHRRGLGFWLLRELADAQALLGERLRIVTMVHELYVLAPPWQAGFWLGQVQALLAARLARASHTVRTNAEGHARWLAKRLPPQAQVAAWPVFSNIGEPLAVPASSDRQPQLIVFGSETTRRRALAGLRAHTAALRMLGIERVVEAGSGAPCPALPGVEVQFAGSLDAAALGLLLAASRFGLIDYPSTHLAKSGVFAAYTAHGCVVLNTSPVTVDADGLAHGVHLARIGAAAELPASAGACQHMADAARHWYAGHKLAAQAAELARWCAEPSDPRQRRP